MGYKHFFQKSVKNGKCRACIHKNVCYGGITTDYDLTQYVIKSGPYSHETKLGNLEAEQVITK